jgi:hypothetical protein
VKGENCIAQVGGGDGGWGGVVAGW